MAKTKEQTLKEKVDEMDKDIKTLWAKLDTTLSMMLNNQHKCCCHHLPGQLTPLQTPNYCGQCLGVCRGHIR